MRTRARATSSLVCSPPSRARDAVTRFGSTSVLPIFAFARPTFSNSDLSAFPAGAVPSDVRSSIRTFQLRARTAPPMR